LLIFKGGNVKIADLGICTASAEGIQRGTTGYCAPEYWDETFMVECDAHTMFGELGRPDVFGLGQTLHVIIDGIKTAHRMPEKIMKAEENAHAAINSERHQPLEQLFNEMIVNYYKSMYKACMPEGYNVNAVSRVVRHTIAEMCSLYQKNRPTAQQCLDELALHRNASNRALLEQLPAQSQKRASQMTAEDVLVMPKRTRTIALATAGVQISPPLSAVIEISDNVVKVKIEPIALEDEPAPDEAADERVATREDGAADSAVQEKSPEDALHAGVSDLAELNDADRNDQSLLNESVKGIEDEPNDKALRIMSVVRETVPPKEARAAVSPTASASERVEQADLGDNERTLQSPVDNAAKVEYACAPLSNAAPAEEVNPFENDQPAAQDKQNAEVKPAAQNKQAAVVNNISARIAPGGQLARSLRELADVATMCRTEQEISQAVANDAEKTALLKELRTRRHEFSPITDKVRFILTYLHEPGTALFACRARMFRLLTGYGANWWRAHRQMIAQVRDQVGQQQQAQP
jgi:hypothetical protein